MMFITPKSKKMDLNNAAEELKLFDELLSQSKITYCIVGGTLLGCLRHKGFIPWDDDIDVLVEERCMYQIAELKPNKVSLINTNAITSNHFGNFTHFAVWKDKEKIDIWPWKKIFINGIECIQTCIGDFAMSKWFPVRKAHFAGMILPIPNDPIHIIEYNFGSNWRTKIKRTPANKSIWECNEADIIEDNFIGRIPPLEEILV